MKLATTGTYVVRMMPDLMGRLHEAEIRARIQRARELAGLSQTDMADLLGVIPRTVQNYEGGGGKAAKVPWDRLSDIAEMTGTTTRWLLYGDAQAYDAAEGELTERLTDIERKLDQLLERDSHGQVALREQEAIDRLERRMDELEGRDSASASPPASRARRSPRGASATGAR